MTDYGMRGQAIANRDFMSTRHSSPAACRADLTRPTETRLHGWGERARTRKCRSEKISLKHPANPLAFQNIVGGEIFRGGAANDLTCGSGAKTRQFEKGCPPGRGAYDND